VVEIPTFRLDISIPEDLIEEIGRVYGYQRIPAVFPTASLIPPKRNEEIFWENMIKNILKETGLTEVYNYSFISQEDAGIYQLKNNKSALIEIKNPVSIEQKYLRPNLIINLLKDVKRNQKNFDEIKIFELGKTFKNAKITKEKKMLAGLATEEAFYELKGIIDLLLQKLGISDIWYDDYKPAPKESKISFWNIPKCAEIKIENEKIGFLGEISPNILQKMKITKKCVAFNIDFKQLLKLVSEEHEYEPLSSFPAAVRDLAILVPKGTKVVEVLNKINVAGGRLVRDVDIFDIYEGEELPEDKKNLAFHIIYQAEDKTLSSEEIDKLQKKIIRILEENPEWEVRK
jgi:phenylalanyl-tRNA synthetase beta chain